MRNHFAVDFSVDSPYSNKAVPKRRSSKAYDNASKDFKGILTSTTKSNQSRRTNGTEPKYASAIEKWDKNASKQGVSCEKTFAKKHDLTHDTVQEVEAEDNAVHQVIAEELDKEAVAYLAELTGMSIELIEKILNGEKEALALGEQNLLPEVQKLVTVLKDDLTLTASHKMMLLEKVEKLVNEMAISSVSDNGDMQQAAESTLKQLQQELAAIKQQLEGLANVHTLIQEGINEAAMQINMQEAQQRNMQEAQQQTAMQDSDGTEGESKEQTAVLGADAKASQEEGSEQKGDASEQKGSNLDKKFQVINLQTKEAGTQSDPVPFNDVIDAKGDVDNVETVTKAYRMSEGNKPDVFKQVVEHAKVVVHDGKSEMTVQLKPENLGKLSLEIVAERGVLVAKFVAESQQVKQIIEANLPQLKDALESQGLNVQGFSVSVGDNSAQREAFEKGVAGQARKNVKSGNQSMAAMGLEYEADYMVENPYQISDSRIDFIA